MIARDRPAATSTFFASLSFPASGWERKHDLETPLALEDIQARTAVLIISHGFVK
jgi:hypothetical protein